jgi:glycosyltransferase involved in cell wall biosynthesis
MDARPLATPTNGIGRYTGALLRAWSGSEHTFLLYSHRPLPPLSLTVSHSIRHGGLKGNTAGTPFAQLTFGRWARQDEVDVFWSPRHHLPVGLGHVPAVVTIHDLAWLRVPATMRWSGRVGERLLMPRAIDVAAAILADSEATRRDLAEFFPDAAPRVRVIPPASELYPANPPPASGDQPYMLFVGTLEPRKNLERVVGAFSLLHARHEVGHRLIIVGNPGWKDRRIRAAIADSPSAAKIEMRERLDDRTLRGLYAGADFLVAPSLYEGFGLQLVEAFGFGKPVITSDRASMPEVAGEAGVLVDPLSTSAIHDAMYRLITDRGFRDGLARAATARAERFSWERAAARTLEAFEAVIAH